MIDLDALERYAAPAWIGSTYPPVHKDDLAAIVRIARAAAVWAHARRVQAGTPVERSILADAVAIAVEQAGL